MPESRKPSKLAGAHLWVTILAGGVGSRFWPLSTPTRPKQLLPLASPRPLIADTMDRARALAPTSHIRILAGRHLVEPIAKLLPELPEDVFLVEAIPRGTGPVLAWAAWVLARRDPEAVLISLHSDHVVDPLDAFRDQLPGAALIAAREELLLTIGVQPHRPETGYGYLEPGEALPGPESAGAFRVKRFHEKPDGETARRYVDGGYLWNSGIFVWSAQVLLEEVERCAPEIARLFPHLEAGRDARFFEEAPIISIDEAVLERSGRVATVRADFAWDDLGSWEALGRTRDVDALGNVAVGEAHVMEGENNIVFSDDRPIVLFGVDDLVAVRTAGVTLVMHRSRAQDLKKLVATLPHELRDSEA